MKIRAKYKGINIIAYGYKRALMYKTGAKYTLNFDTESNYSSEKFSEQIRLSKFNMDYNSDSDLFYKTLKKFLQNWEVI